MRPVWAVVEDGKITRWAVGKPGGERLLDAQRQRAANPDAQLVRFTQKEWQQRRADQAKPEEKAAAPAAAQKSETHTANREALEDA
jgi:hypothetical protein